MIELFKNPVPAHPLSRIDPFVVRDDAAADLIRAAAGFGKRLVVIWADGTPAQARHRAARVVASLALRTGRLCVSVDAGGGEHHLAPLLVQSLGPSECTPGVLTGVGQAPNGGIIHLVGAADVHTPDDPVITVLDTIAERRAVGASDAHGRHWSFPLHPDTICIASGTGPRPLLARGAFEVQLDMTSGQENRRNVRPAANAPQT